jgi:two-component system repressor protein LuxO
MRLAVTAAEGIAAALDWQPDAVLVDLQLPDGSGFDVMRRLRAEGVDAALIVVTANGSIGVAVEAMREGAVDFLVKPFAKARLATTLGNLLEKRALASELKTVKSRLAPDRFFSFIGGSEAMRAVYRTIESVAPSKANVFVTGESGTGKELAAEAIHKASPRRGKAFVALNCGAIPRDLLESEIFGHVKGAFTGATDNRLGAAKAADGGTLLLDEIGEMPLDMQVKLLRFVQTGSFTPVGSSKPEKVDVRFVCATNRDPLAEVEAGRFREDLYYRVKGLHVELAPLRDPRRLADIRPLLSHHLAKHERALKKKTSGLTRDALRALLQYSWPGNVREIGNVCSALVTHASPGASIDVEDIRRLCPYVLSGPKNPNPEAYLESEDAAYSEAIRAFRKRLILDRLRRHGGSAVEAAASLKISGPTFYRYWADAKRFP